MLNHTAPKDQSKGLRLLDFSDPMTMQESIRFLKERYGDNC